jgi:hypothetical protein
LQVLFVLLLAFVIAVAGTAFHQTNLGGFPVGIVLAFSALLLGSIEARNRGKVRYLFPVFLGIWIFIFSQDWSGDKLLPANELGFIWTYGSVLVAALVSMWPKIRTYR